MKDMNGIKIIAVAARMNGGVDATGLVETVRQAIRDELQSTATVPFPDACPADGTVQVPSGKENARNHPTVDKSPRHHQTEPSTPYRGGV